MNSGSSSGSPASAPHTTIVGGGSVLRPINGRRDVQVYTVLDSEMETLSIMNNLQVGFISVATTTAALGVDKLYDATVGGSAITRGTWWAIGTLAVASVGFLWAAWQTRKKRTSTLQAIKDATTTTEPSA